MIVFVVIYPKKPPKIFAATLIACGVPFYVNMNNFKYGLPVPNAWYICLKPDTLEQKAVAMNLTAQQRLLDLFGRQSVVRSLDLEQYEIPRVATGNDIVNLRFQVVKVSFGRVEF